MDTLSGKINKQSVWVLTNTLDESTWKQGQFRIPELELDEYYVRSYLYVKVESWKGLSSSFFTAFDINLIKT